MATEVIHGLEQLTARPTGCVVTIGNFDGVHRGHQSILAEARRVADQAGGRVVAMTFEPPPARVVAPDRAPEPVMQIDQRCEALADAGADMVVLLHTTRALLAMTPEQFVRDVLAERLRPRHVVEGRNFFFGHDRAGNVETLAELGGRFGFTVDVVPPVSAELSNGQSTRISSSLIRRLIRDGHVEDAAGCLGRPHTMRGVVVPGEGLGRQMDHPTANLDCGEQLAPADGVYAGRAIIGGQVFDAAISVGTRPTVGEGLPRAIEAHLLAPPGDLYDRRMSLEFHHRLRPQEKFDSPEKLRRQMIEDVKRVRERLS